MKKSLYLFLGAVFVASVVWAARYPLYHARWLGTGTKNATEQFSIQTPSAGASANFVPGVDNTNALGTSALRFSDVRSMDMTLGDDLTVGDVATVTGRLVSNGLTQLTVSTAPRSALAVAAMTIGPGTLIYNSTDGELCISTGSTQSTFVVISSQTAEACRH